jgi:AcrR family transcriptional regulator
MTEERPTALGLGGGAGTALPMPPTQARGAEKRDRLYVAALDRFDRLGVDATRVEDVVDDAGVSWATFFRYFPRKEDVLIEGAARHYRGRVKPVAEAGIRSRRRIRTVIKDTFIALSTPGDMPPGLHAASLLQVIAHPNRFAALLDDGSDQPLIELLTEVVAEGQSRGEVRDDVPAMAIGMTIAAGAFFPGVQAAAIGGDSAAAMTAALELIWDGAGEGSRERRAPRVGVGMEVA